MSEQNGTAAAIEEHFVQDPKADAPAPAPVGVPPIPPPAAGVPNPPSGGGSAPSLDDRVATLEAKVDAINWLQGEMLGAHLRLAQTKAMLDDPAARAGLAAQFGQQR